MAFFAHFWRIFKAMSLIFLLDHTRGSKPLGFGLYRAQCSFYGWYQLSSLLPVCSGQFTWVGSTLLHNKKRDPPFWPPLFFSMTPPLFCDVGKIEIFPYFSHTRVYVPILPYSYWLYKFWQYPNILSIIFYDKIWGQFWGHFGFLRVWKIQDPKIPKKWSQIISYKIIPGMFGHCQNL